MSIKITKNSLCDLDVFFYKGGKNGFKNVYRPTISFIKIDNATRVEPAFHLGFEESMGYNTSLKITGGTMVFEVLDGYPLQSLLFYYNQSSMNSNNVSDLKYRLEDLEAMDFYCVNKRSEDPYGDFILHNLKFTSTKMEQGIHSQGRVLVADFVCKNMIPFRIPYFYNYFKSDNYDQHVVRSKEEIEQIKQDIYNIEDRLTSTQEDYLRACLFGGKHYRPYSTLIECLEYVWNEFVDTVYAKKIDYTPLTDIQVFIREFYSIKNDYELKTVNIQSKLDFLSFIDNPNIDYVGGS